MPQLTPEEVRARLPPYKIKKIKESVHFKCEKENTKYPPRKLRVHHINPVMIGGANKEHNLIVLCSHHHNAATANAKGFEKAALRELVEKRKPTVRKEIKEILREKLPRGSPSGEVMVCATEKYTHGIVCDIDTNTSNRKRITK